MNMGVAAYYPVTYHCGSCGWQGPPSATHDTTYTHPKPEES
jgi:hypothetical protein